MSIFSKYWLIARRYTHTQNSVQTSL